MYSLQELEAMAPSEAVAIAESMGMKKAGSSDVQDVIYYILDNQASATAKEQASKVALRQQNGEKKRGRKKKVQQDQPDPQPANNNKPSNTATEEISAEPAKKKRGRKPKNSQPEPAAVQTSLFEETDVPAPSQTENNTKDQVEPAPQPKKRGRKPKNQAEALEPVTVAETEAEKPKGKPGRKPKAAQEMETAPQQTKEPAKEEPKPHQNNKNAASLDSFFNTMKGKTFIPRGQQIQKPENPQENKNVPENKNIPENKPAQENQPQTFALPAGPVVIQEPSANSQQKLQFGKNMSKKQRQQLQRQAQNNRPVPAAEGIVTTFGVLEIMPEGYGFLRSSDYNYMPSPDDIYISQQQIKQYGLRTGDVVEASVRPPMPDEKYYPMVKAITINGLDPVAVRDRMRFEHLVPLFPEEKFNITNGKYSNISTRIVDMFAPIGKGQRALIVAPPKTGKTILLKDIANAISENHPETYIIMLLIDERPEEVTDMARSVNAEVIASTFDEPAERHVRIAGIVLEKAKRLVESGHDVVIMLDSITRLARAYNTVSPASGKILSGGVDANALQRPKRFFGAARNIEGGGSLTIIATALTETSSKMDEVIFEEFKGTGNMELQLDRKLSNKRIFPAVDIVASSTRRDDLLLPEETLNRMWVLRNYLGDMNSLEAMEFMKKRMEMTRSNEELLVTMDR